jgi:hypothetical protein
MGFAAFSGSGEVVVLTDFFLLKRKPRDFGQGKRQVM